MAGRVLQCVEAVPIHASAPNFAVRDSTSGRCPCRGPCGTDSFVCPALGRTSSFSSLANAQVLCAGESTPIDLIRSGGRQPRAIIRVSGVWRQFGFVVGTYRTVEKLVPLVPALLDVALEGIRVERLEQLKAAEELCRDRHDGTPVVKLSAVLLDVSDVRSVAWVLGRITYVWRAEYCDENPIVKEFVAILNNHVRSAHQVKVVRGKEIRNNLFAKAIADSPLIGLPVLFHFRRVGPQKVVEQAVIGNIGGSGNVADVIHVAKSRRQAAVNAKDLAGNNRSNRESVECIDKRLPDLDVAPPLAFVVEAVDAGDVSALVVAAKEEEVLGVFQLEAEEKEDGLK